MDMNMKETRIEGIPISVGMYNVMGGKASTGTPMGSMNENELSHDMDSESGRSPCRKGKYHHRQCI